LEFWPARRCLALLGAALIFMALPASVHAALIAYDNFDTPVGSNSTLTSRTISGWPTTYQSSNQIYGVTNRTEALSEGASNLVDTSFSANEIDLYGLLKTTDTGNVFAVERPEATFSAIWEFDISKSLSNDLSVGIDFAAMGDWENYPEFTFTASLDGAPDIDLFTSNWVPGATPQNYNMESGAYIRQIPHALTLTDDTSNTTYTILNDFQRLYADISEPGEADTLTLTYTASYATPLQTRVFAFDNIEVSGEIPVPGTIWLLGAGFLGFIGVRRRFQK